jgi:hypothetical protein
LGAGSSAGGRPGEPAPDRFDSDIAMVLPPLSLFLCYWKSTENKAQDGAAVQVAMSQRSTRRCGPSGLS